MSAAKKLLLAKLKPEESEKQHEATLRLQQQEAIIEEKWHQTKNRMKTTKQIKIELDRQKQEFCLRMEKN